MNTVDNTKNSSPAKTIITFGRVLKWLSYSFLGACVCIVLLVLFAGSNLGLKSAAYVANRIDGINIGDIEGSIYSSFTLSDISIDESVGVGLEAKNINVDISLMCLIDFAFCLENVRLDRVSLVMPVSEEQAAQAASNEYITAPLPISVKRLSVGTLLLSQQALIENDELDVNQEPEQGGSTQINQSKVLALNTLLIENVAFDQRVTINDISLTDLYLFDTSNELNTQIVGSQTSQSNDENNASNASTTSKTHTANKAASNEPFTLEKLRNLLKTAPKVDMPEVFIPINAKLESLSVEALCWLVIDKPDPNNCLKINSTELAIEKQVLSVKSVIDAEPVLTYNGLRAQTIELSTRLNIPKDWEHDVSVSLVDSRVDLPVNSPDLASRTKLTLSAKGTTENTRLQLQASTLNAQNAQVETLYPILDIRLIGDINDTALPIDLDLSLSNISRFNGFLLSESTLPEISGNAQVKGTWKAYELNAKLNIQNSAFVDKGLSEVSLAASLSPANQSMQIKTLESGGEIGKASVTGRSQLRESAQAGEGLLINSSLNIKLDSVNFGVLKAQANNDSSKLWNTDLNGAFSLSHVFHDDWMSGKIYCEQLGGRVDDYNVDFQCDLGISKDGNINIRQFALVQGANSVSMDGSVRLPSSDYFDLSAEQLLQSSANLTLQAAIKDASTLHDSLNGQMELDGKVKGNVEKPNIAFNSSISGFSFNDISIRQANIDLFLDASKNFAFKLDSLFNELVINDIVVSESFVRGSGDKSQHSLELFGTSEALSIEQSIDGGFAAGNDFALWQGKIDALELTLPFDRIQLDEPAELSVDIANNAFSAQDHCYLSSKDKERLCLSDLSFKDHAGGLKAIASYNLARAGRYFAPEIILPATSLPLRSNINLQYSQDNGLSMSAFNNLIDGVLEVESNVIDLSAIVANLTLNQETLSSAIFAGTQGAGTLGVVSNITLDPENRNHEGQVRINDFDLGIFKQFLHSVEQMSGLVNAEIGFSGPLDSPELDGSLQIDSGEVFVVAYPYPLTEFNHDMRFEGKGASMQGAFKLGKGSANYSAQLNLIDEFFVEGTLKGDGMQVAFDSIKSTISPDLAFSVSPQDLMVSGSIAIPSAEIKVKELPESAQTPSSDVLIVGQEPSPPVIPMGIYIDLDIQIDKAKRKFVTVDALDLKASLAGNLDLKVEQKRSADGTSFQPLQTSLNGQVDILDGSYIAYSQNLLVRSGKIFFNGEPTLPQFDISAIRNPLNTDGDVIAGIRVTGNPVVPRVELFSDPPMIQARQLSYLLQGSDLTSDEGGARTSNSTMLLNALVGFGVRSSGDSVGRLGNALGFDSLSIQTAGAGDDTQVQITGRIAEDIQITYGIGIRTQAPEIVLKYQLMPQLFIEATSGIEQTVDLFYQLTRGKN